MQGDVDRLTVSGRGEAVGAALARIPAGIRGLLRFDVLTEDPLFVGLHAYTSADDGRGYRVTAHVAYPHHQTRPLSERKTTVVLPADVPLWVVVHELGHVLDEATGFSHQAEPVTAYAATSRYEAFAEAFTSWVLGAEYTPWMPDLRERSPQSDALFRQLSR